MPDGGVTSPRGWRAGATYAGVRTYGEEPRFDIGILASDRPAAAAGVFTKNLVFGPAVALDRARVANGRGQAIVANSGCSNTATGEQGERDALRMTALVAAQLGIAEDDVFVASTGVIGRHLPMQLIEPGITSIAVSEDGGAAFARAIMTTDTRPKSHAATFTASDGTRYTVGGVAKGSGMVHPDMATVFCFLTSDAPADAGWLQRTLTEVANVSINMVDVDMDTSTSDTMLLLANGAAGGTAVDDAHPDAPRLRAAIEAVAVELARDLARDGEGARTLIEVRVCGAASIEDARRAARTVSSSPLVKTMVTGRDANLGRVLMAIGRSGAALDPARASVWIGEHAAFERGTPSQVPYEVISQAMDVDEVVIRVDLGTGGPGEAVAWGCDLTEAYVRINADYTT
ncbi:MAG: bifunctional glutamate N-acetyltransferase/amino-acid acetyltransferase ArgJ [Dehalococcoidia bacterium]|nr:bifunctional glutamate N-acetyltransferase/amino-acid acetyltransferase ArgJ [Dehalococcoidia bacterium]